jgi:hypothetical protein
MIWGLINQLRFGGVNFGRVSKEARLLLLLGNQAK